MALTAARGFSGGPMADIDYGQAAGSSAWVESSSGGLAVTQPNTGVRSVSIAAGTCDAYGIRVTNDAALAQAITAPGSGGAWFMVAVRRDWSTKTATVVVLAGPTTGSTTVPGTIPTTLPATMQNAPGTQFDQPLTWVFASSANTTLTLFDVRLLETGARGLHAVSLLALIVASMTVLRDGATVTVGRFQLSGVYYHEGSQWQRGGGIMRPVPGTVIATSGETDLDGTAANTIVGIVNGFPAALGLRDGQKTRSTSLFQEFRLNGGTMRCWDSDWVNVTGGSGTSGIGVTYSECRYRFRNGKVNFRVAATVQTLGSGTIKWTLPVTAEASGANQPSGLVRNARGTSIGFYSTEFDVGYGAIFFRYQSNTSGGTDPVTATAPSAPAVNDLWGFDLEYAPAA